MISRNRAFVNLAACTAIWVALWIVWSVPLVAARSSWQAEWEKTLRAAEAELPLALLLRLLLRYDRVLEYSGKDTPERSKRTSSLPSHGNSLAWPILQLNGALKISGDVVSYADANAQGLRFKRLCTSRPNGGASLRRATLGPEKL
jgi:hypothetical protein